MSPRMRSELWFHLCGTVSLLRDAPFPHLWYCVGDGLFFYETPAEHQSRRPSCFFVLSHPPLFIHTYVRIAAPHLYSFCRTTKDLIGGRSPKRAWKGCRTSSRRKLAYTQTAIRRILMVDAVIPFTCESSHTRSLVQLVLFGTVFLHLLSE